MTLPKFIFIVFISSTYACASDNLSSLLTSYSDKKIPKIEAPVELEKKNEVSTPISSLNTEEKSEEMYVSHDSVKFLEPIRNDKVKFWEKYFLTRGREVFQRFINRGEKNKLLVMSIFKKYNIPTDLYFVGLIESGYSVNATSVTKAKGPWQFMPGTAERYNLKMNKHVDERISLVKSTEAAANYLRDLHNIFGNWELVLSSYNAGEYGMIRRIVQGNTRNFYELSKKDLIPKETQHYVPKVLAAMNLYYNASKYGFTIPEDKESVYTKTKVLNLKNSYSLDNVSKTLNVSKDDILALNPDLRSDRTPEVKNSSYTLYIPSQKNSSLAEMTPVLEPIKEPIKIERKIASVSIKSFKKEKPQIHIVKKGEFLSKIAKRYAISPKKIILANNLKKSSVNVNQRLVIPRS